MLKYKNTPETEEVRQARERNALNTMTHQFIIIKVQQQKKKGK